MNSNPPTDTVSSTGVCGVLPEDTGASCLLVAYSPPGAATVDRTIIPKRFTIGRSLECDLPVSDPKMSGRHLRITRTTRLRSGVM